MQNLADDNSSPQTCQHLNSRRHSLFDKEEETSSPFGIVFLYAATGSPCWTESDSHQSSFDSFCTNTPLHDTSTNWKIDQEAEMAASWSSAATGKPQLSYAERLRRAKEGTPKAHLTVSASQPQTDVKSLSSNGRIHNDSSEESKGDKESPSSSLQIVAPISPLASTLDQDAKADSTNTVETSTSVKAFVNVWDARRRVLQEKEKAKEEQKISGSTNGAIADVSQSSRNKSDAIAKATNNSKSTSRAPRDDGGTNKQAGRSESWLQKVHLLNGGNDNGISEKVSASNQARDVKGKKKKGIEPAHITSNIKDDNTTPILSTADPTAWPSPDASLTLGSKSNADNSKKLDEERGETSLSSITGIKGLDIEVIKPKAGLESPKRGKQWVPIVPTITHATTLPRNPSKKKTKTPNASASASSTPTVFTPDKVEAKTVSTSPTTFTRRQNQKRPTPLPSSIDKEEEVQPGVSISNGNEARLLQSPSNDLRGLSPRLARMALSNQSIQSRAGSLVASPRRDYSSSPIRSPSLAGGSVRGPRFSGDLKSPKEAHTWLQPLSSDDVLLDLSIQSEVEIEPSNNALFLSNGYNSDASPLASAQMSQNTTTDGSYPPTRASTTLLSPINQSIQQGIIPWRTNSTTNRSPSSAPSPRGSRGRGKTSKTSDGHSVGESSSSRNDNEERGLPSDVPSGPRRQQNGDSTISSRGYTGAGGGSFRRGPYYQYPLPYGMYGPPQPQPGGFFYPLPGQIPLESTPTEFAPQGDATKSEPSEALLHQIEFYFSHRNLEGDFFLRKNMDLQGFVPIEVVANFKKVKKMTEKLDVIKETLLYSKVLFIDVERNLVRKAVDWHLYTLIDGERPQQNMYSPRQPILQFGSPPPSSLPSFTAHTSPPPFAPYYGQPGPPPPFFFSSPFHQGPAPPAAGLGYSGLDNSSWSQQQQQQQLQRPTGSADEQHSNGDGSGDNMFGVIAAEGLAAEKRPE